MKNKNVVIAIFVMVWYSIVFGFVVPSFISANNDILPLAGVSLAVAHVVGPILWFNREKKQNVV